MNSEMGEPHCPGHSRERFLQRRRRYERARYWDPSTKGRKRRLARAARECGRLPKLVQLQLDVFFEPACVRGPAKDASTTSKELLDER